jgi:hypothetical protein
LHDGAVSDVQENSAVWPATSPEDTLDLYGVHVMSDGKRMIAHEPFARLSAGPRGGVVRENY